MSQSPGPLNASHYTEGTDQSIAELYADATLLTDFIEQSVRENSPVPPIPHGFNFQTGAFSLRSKADEELLAQHRRAVERKTFKDLEAGRLIAIGCVTGADGLPIPRLIASNFWFVATTRYGHRDALHGDLYFERVRVRAKDSAAPEAATPTPAEKQADTVESIPRGKAKRGMESNEDYRQEAIDHFAARDQKKWWRRTGPDDRREEYYGYLGDKHGIDRDDRGFDVKSWENSETQYKRERGMLRSQ